MNMELFNQNTGRRQRSRCALVVFTVALFSSNEAFSLNGVRSTSSVSYATRNLKLVQLTPRVKVFASDASSGEPVNTKSEGNIVTSKKVDDVKQVT